MTIDAPVTEPKPSEGDAKTASALSKDPAEFLGKVVLPASVLTYVLGFVVAAPYYLRHGVPFSALPNSVFLAAGVLFVTTLSIPAAASYGIMHITNLRVVYKAVFLSVSACLFGLAAAGAFGLAIGAFVAFAFVPVNYLFWVTTSDNHPTNLWLVYLSTIGGCAFLFSTVVFAQVTPALGGGRKTPLDRVELRAHREVAPEKKWMAALCKTPSSELGDPVIRTVFKIHEDSSFLYVVASDAVDGRSPTGCYARVANSELPILGYNLSPIVWAFDW